MRLRPLGLLVLACQGFATPAEAVLFHDIAAMAEKSPAYQGCEPIGAGSGRAQPELCRDSKSPEQYCSVFRSVPSLKTDETTAAAFEACVGFFNRSVEAQQLFCDYQKDAERLADSLNTKAAGVASAAGADATAGGALRCAQKIYFYYRHAALKEFEVLDKAFAISKRKALGAADAGSERLLQEVNCQQDGVPGKAPGFLVLGAATHSLADQKGTLIAIERSLQSFQGAMQLQWAAADAGKDQISQRQIDLGSISVVRKLDDPSSSDITVADVQGLTQPPSYLGKGAHETSVEGAGEAAKGTIEHFTEAESKAAGVGIAESVSVAEEASLKAGGKALALGGGGGLVVGLGVTYLENGKVTKADVATNVATTGVSVLASMLGAPASVGVGATVGVALVIEKIKEDFNAYEREVLRPYVEYAKPLVKELGMMTSQEVARKYKEIKVSLAYCSKCTDHDLQYGCPGQQGAVHGLNDNFHDANADPKELFTNPWVKAAYSDYRARYPKGSPGFPFRGPIGLPPSSKIQDREPTVGDPAF